jgi:(p)ppGpp synthase/HD superfamily hydrolase
MKNHYTKFLAGQLARAIQVAAKAHGSQLDGSGQPYILHPLRVMLKCKRPEEQIAAVLHDVLEDTPVTKSDLQRRGFSPAVIRALLAVTRRKQESYASFITRARKDKIGSRVKIADLSDNLNRSRTKKPTAKDVKRKARYKKAWERLTGKSYCRELVRLVDGLTLS